MRMRVVPKCRRLLIDFKTCRPRLTGIDRLVGCAVHLGWHMHAMPMHGRQFIELVDHFKIDQVTSVNAKSGTKVGSVDAASRSTRGWQERRLPVLHDQSKPLASLDFDPVEFGWNLQSVLKIKPGVGHPDKQQVVPHHRCDREQTGDTPARQAAGAP